MCRDKVPLCSIDGVATAFLGDCRTDSTLLAFAAGRLDQGSLDGIQPGWTMTLNNDPSWQAAMEGHAIVGAAAISVQQFSKLFLRAAAPRDVSDIVAGPLSASGKLTVLRHGEEVTLNTLRLKLLPQRSK